MTYDFVFLVSMPGLRERDLQFMPRLKALAGRGASRRLIPSFPCVTSPVQMNMLTGRLPDEHGIIGNGFYHRDCGEVELWVGRNGLVEGDQLWDSLARRGVSQAAWIPQNIRDAAADFIVTPEPKHHPDGRMDLWCYSKPEGLYTKLLADLGHFPLMNFWGPMAGIQSTEWIVNAALWLLQRERPRFNYIYVPHLDYAAQKHGPDSPQQQQACAAADAQLGRLFDGVEALKLGRVGWLIVGEYAMTDVTRVIYPNRVLRDAGLAIIDDRDGAEYLDLSASTAFAVVDHQFAHVYVQQASEIDAVAGIFEPLDGIAEVLSGHGLSKYNLRHERSGEVVLVCEPDAWLAYYWWHEDRKAPPFARTVDIHNKPGYDPVELFFDPATKSIPLNASLVKGSHGAPALRPEQYATCVASDESMIPQGASDLMDTDVRGMIEAVLG